MTGEAKRAKQMITDDEAEKAVDFLRDNAIEAAQARADRIYVEQFRKTVKAQLMKEFEQKGFASGIAQEREAYADPRYMEQLDAIQEAVFRDEKCRFLREAEMARFEAWRTFSKNQRTGP